MPKHDDVVKEHGDAYISEAQHGGGEGCERGGLGGRDVEDERGGRAKGAWWCLWQSSLDILMPYTISSSSTIWHTFISKIQKC